MSTFATQWDAQQARNTTLLENSRYMRDEVTSSTVPLSIDINKPTLSADQVNELQALDILAARTAIKSLVELGRLGEVDHLGGGLDLISALNLTLALVDYEKVSFTIEHAHTSIGYYSMLAARGFLDEEAVVNEFRQGIDIAGHVSWVPGGTQLNGGRLGVMIPAAVGEAVGKRAIHGDDAWVLCHVGDAGWISGQALNGFNGADLHNAPVTFIMHRNGIQLSGTNASILDKDPRPMIAAMGVEIIECESLHEPHGYYAALRQAREAARSGRPTLIYPTGTKSTLSQFGTDNGITAELAAFAGEHSVSLDTEVWLPGALMSHRDVIPMLECIFAVNNLEGGETHHDGSMKGRDANVVLNTAMMSWNDAQRSALENLQAAIPARITTKARPAPGSPNLLLTEAQAAEAGAALPAVGAVKSARVGVEAAYAAVAKAHPDNVFVVSCDLDPSTKLAKARSFLAENHQYEMSIEEQVSAIMVNGLAVASDRPQLNVVSTFAAFYEGIAREAFEMWRYQRNLNGINEGLNSVMHLSHVGSCTGRDHFSGWSLDWVNLAIGYLPYLHRFYAPCDSASAFIAIRDMAACYGAHIIGIPRDNLPTLAKSDGTAVWGANDAFETVTAVRESEEAGLAILAFGAPAAIAVEASETLSASGIPVDVHVVNALPFDEGQLEALMERYPAGVVTVEDGLIGNAASGLRGFANIVASVPSDTPTDHVGIVDPRIAPAEGHYELWDHFGITTETLIKAVKSLG